MGDLYNNSTFNFQNKSDVWLDMKSQVGKASGVELVVGGMTAGGWTADNAAVLSNPSANVLRITHGGTNSPAAYQNIATTGKRYRIKGTARGDGTGIPRIQGYSTIWTGTSSTADQSFDFTYTQDTNTRVWLGSTLTVAGYVEFEDVCVEEVLQYTPDKSGKGNDLTLGDGSDTTKMPAFLNAGFETDGGDYMQSENVGILDTSLSEFTMISVVDPAGSVGNDCLFTYEDGNTYLAGMIFRVGSTKQWRFYGGNVTSNASFIGNNAGKTVIVGTTTGSETSIWVNGQKGTDAVSPAAINLTSNQKATALARGDTVTSVCASGIKTYANIIIPFKLTPTQIRQVTAFLLNQYS